MEPIPTQIEMTVSKIEIALGYCATACEFVKKIDIDRAVRTLKALEEQLALPVDQWPTRWIIGCEFTCVVLDAAGIDLVGQVLELDDKEIARIWRMGPDRIAGIDRDLDRVGLRRVGAVAEGV
jgi:hypothetical protein